MKDFNQIKFQEQLADKFKTVHKSYRFRTSRAATRKLVKQGYTLKQAIGITNDAFDMANNMSMGLKHSEAIKGKPVTTVNNKGGLGFGYLVNGAVWKTTGSMYAVDATQDVFPMVRYIEDNGDGYRKATKGLLDVSAFLNEGI